MSNISSIHWGEFLEKAGVAVAQTGGAGYTDVVMIRKALVWWW